jgi:hypothetical protein
MGAVTRTQSVATQSENSFLEGAEAAAHRGENNSKTNAGLALKMAPRQAATTP